jgi:hypothetical protein
VSQYTYVATHLISGALLADNLPLNVQSFSQQLNGGGSLTGTLNLSETYAVNAPSVAAVAPRRAVLWVLMDGYPVWSGIIWDWPDMSRSAGTLPIAAQTVDSLWSHRLVTDTIEYAGVDLYTAYLDLLKYGLSKQSSYISSVSPAATRPAGYLALMASNGGVSRLVVPTGPAAVSGVPWTASYAYSDLTQVSSAWSDMTASGNLEYVFSAGLDSNGELATFVRLAYEQLGRPLGSCGYTLNYPGNVLDYGYQVTGSQSSNYIWATAPPNGSELQWQSQYPYGADLSDLDAGYPVMESTVSWQGSVVTSQAQVNGFATGQVALVTQGMTLPTITLGGGSSPTLRDIVLGDTTQFAATSPLHPPQADGAPGLQQQVRITGWTVQPPGPTQSESMQLQTSAVIVGQ